MQTTLVSLRRIQDIKAKGGVVEVEAAKESLLMPTKARVLHLTALSNS